MIQMSMVRNLFNILIDNNQTNLLVHVLNKEYLKSYIHNFLANQQKLTTHFGRDTSRKG